MVAEISELVGNREVVASSQLVLAGGEFTASIKVDDLFYNFLFLHAAEQFPQSLHNIVDDKTTTFTVSGNIGSDRLVWWYDHVARWNGKKMSVAFGVQRYAGRPDHPAIWILEYTFSAAPYENAPALLNRVSP